MDVMIGGGRCGGDVVDICWTVVAQKLLYFLLGTSRDQRFNDKEPSGTNEK